MATQPIPVIATGKVFADYLAAARTNLDNLVRCAAGLRDKQFEFEAQFILDNFDSAAVDALAMINADVAA